MILTSLLLLVVHIWAVTADYECVCDQSGTLSVYSTMSELGSKIGYMYEPDCKQLLHNSNVADGWYTVAFEHKVGYILNGSPAVVKVCNGDPPSGDQVNTAFTTGAYASSKATTSTTAAKAIVTTAHLTMTPSTAKVPQGHTELCPAHIKTDMDRYVGFLDQFGDYCYELVNGATQWDNAERHCHLISQGHLVDIPDQKTQDFLVSFLSVHHFIDNVWIGLTDKANEAVYTWTTGRPLSYTNFAVNQVSQRNHSLSDCVVMKKDGTWRDIQCGVGLVFGTGFGESHPYICQYNVTSKPPDIFHSLTDVILG